MMIERVPDTPTPIGCLVGFLAFFPAVFSGLAFLGAYKAFGQNPPETEIGIAFCIYRIRTVGNRKHQRIGNSLST